MLEDCARGSLSGSWRMRCAGKARHVLIADFPRSSCWALMWTTLAAQPLTYSILYLMQCSSTSTEPSGLSGWLASLPASPLSSSRTSGTLKTRARGETVCQESHREAARLVAASGARLVASSATVSVPAFFPSPSGLISPGLHLPAYSSSLHVPSRASAAS